MQNLYQAFQEQFETNEQPSLFFAPGRINLIGEHTDYNGGHVLPAAISFGTYALGRKREDQTFRFYSMNATESGIITCTLADLSYNNDHDWANYPKGMIKYLAENGHPVAHGADLLFYGNIPNGAGLSSSASIEMATGVLIEGLFNQEVARLDMIQLAQKVENEYIGVNSGIMDQFAVGMGREDHAILLNCQTLDYHYAPVKLDQHAIVIINTNKQRALAGSKYNERRSQCEQALADLQQQLSIDSLGELSSEQFEQHKHLIQSEINRKRAKHVIYENERTLEALKQLQAGNLKSFGTLMNESHRSLQQDYEVTGLELDTIVQAAWEGKGVIGARMTGAGFGGCAIAIVQKDTIDDFQKNTNQMYRETVGYDATFYTAALGDGAKQL
ncbi:galactokinase [Shouchella shacheensis]|uniref:galactokinase n=1 Tax=Shouchella shacheensis TaxID=1649580 RepID=UPI0007400302|nr:galactokinase [Shouchella shacheensis]